MSGTIAPPQTPVPQMPSGQPQLPPQAMQNLQAFGQAAQAPMQSQGQGQPRLTPAEMARLGRFGDQVVAHLTPGEIAVPPEIQSPKVLATLDRAFAQAHVSPQQFQAGSPASSHNPMTGAPEYSLWAALLPFLGSALGSFIPGIGTAAGMAAGGALGGAAGGAIDKTGPLGILGGAAGGGLAGYLGGGGFGDLFGAAPAAAAGAGSSAEAIAARMAAGDSPAGIGSIPGTITGAPTPGLLSQVPWKGAALAGAGGMLGSSLAPQPEQSTTPPGFNTPMHPLNTNFGQLLGSGQASVPNFANYNPYAAVTGQPYRFF